MDNPKVTVLMCTYNRSAKVNGISLVERAIISFLKQDYENANLIILNDASTDNTAEILAKYEGHPKISVHHAEKNNLPPKNWNVIWDLVPTDTELICQLHDDDELINTGISARVKLFQDNPELQVVYAGAITQNLAATDFNTFPGQPVDKERILTDEYINFVTLMYRPNLPFRFEVELRYYFDWLFKIRCLLECKVGYTPDPVVLYTVHHGQETNKCRREKMNDIEEKAMRKILEKIYIQ